MHQNQKRKNIKNMLVQHWQIYLWPMWNSVAKNLLINNEDIRNSILTCLSGVVVTESQVLDLNLFEKRALHYLYNIFSRQKKPKDREYENVHPVIAVNVLAAEQTPMYRSDLIKYWSLTDQISRETLPYLTLIQYNLFKVKENFESFWSQTPYLEKEKIDPEMIKEWLEFFSEAHKLREFHQCHFVAVNKAYEAVEVERADTSNPEIAEVIQVQKEFYENLDFFKAELAEERREKAIKEGEQQMLFKMVKKLLNQNKTDMEICEFAEIDLVSLKEIKQLLRLNVG